MTRSPCSELRVNKMEDDKKKNAKGRKVLEISCADDKRAKQGESLQEAFKKFRKERQVWLISNMYQASVFKYSVRLLQLLKN